jgi:hypothetical protein
MSSQQQDPNLPAIVEAPPVLAEHLEEDSERIDWIIEAIADAGYTPTVDARWRGQRTIVGQAIEELGIEKIEAERLVIEAVKVLSDANREMNATVEKNLLVRRLKLYRDLIYKQLRGKDIEITWEWRALKDDDGEELLDPATGQPKLIKVPKRQVESEGFNPQTFNLLLEIEKIIISLYRMDDGPGAGDAIAKVFAAFDQNADGEVTNRKTVMSVSRKMKDADLAALGAKGQAVLKAAMDQQRKNVKSTEVNPPEEGSDGQ